MRLLMHSHCNYKNHQLASRKLPVTFQLLTDQFFLTHHNLMNNQYEDSNVIHEIKNGSISVMV